MTAVAKSVAVSQKDKISVKKSGRAVPRINGMGSCLTRTPKTHLLINDLPILPGDHRPTHHRVDDSNGGTAEACSLQRHKEVSHARNGEDYRDHKIMGY